MTDAKVEFGGAAWKAHLLRLARDLAKSAVLPDRTVCEVYEGAPLHLSKTGRLVWTLRFRRGEATLDDRECADDEADSKVIADYVSLLPVARKIVEPGEEAEAHEAIRDLKRRGKFRRIRGDDDHRDYTLHNRLAALTM